MDRKNEGAGTLENMNNSESARSVMVDVIKGFSILMIIMTHVAGMTKQFRDLIFYPFTVIPAVSVFLVLSAYVFELSEEKYRKKQGRPWTIWDWFETERFVPRLRRFLYPYLLTTACLCVILTRVLGVNFFRFKYLFRILAMGGRGPGAYYIILMFEFLLAFPLIKYWADKDPLSTVLGLIVLNIAYEAMARYVWNLSDTVYDRVILRMIVQLGLGIFLARYQKQLDRSVFPQICFLLGAVYLAGIYYAHYQQMLKINRFISGSFFTGLFAFGVISIFLRLEPWSQKHRRLLAPLCYLGKASYHILLAQMVCFYLMRYFELESGWGSLPRVILIDYAVCLTTGCLFYEVYRRIEEAVGKMILRRKGIQSKEDS